MTIQELHIENNAYRDMIKDLKEQINKLDRHIQVNEIEIGKQLGEMERIELEAAGDCTLCLGECRGSTHV